MKKSDIYIAIINEPFYMAEYELFGRRLKDFVQQEIIDYPFGIYCCEKEIPQPNTRYTAIIYTDMAAVTASALEKALNTLEAENLKSIRIGKGKIICSGCKNTAKSGIISNDFLSITDTTSLNIVYNIIKARRTAQALADGAVILGDAEIDYGVQIEKGAVIENGVRIKKGSKIGEKSVIGAFSTISASDIGRGAHIRMSLIEGSKVGDNATIGPYCYIRNGADIGRGARIGDFVEIKNSLIGEGVKAAHLAYIGDAEVGEDTNVGCGSVFCNYDGKTKHHAKVGKKVFIGANTNLVAPVEVGDNCFIAAGSTVTASVPANTFVIARERQINKDKKQN